jgi:short-subunit dehydrogenase
MTYYEKKLKNRGSDFKGKTVVLFGATGGIGNELCRYILTLGANLITVDRNQQKAADLKEKLLNEFSDASINCLTADLEDLDSVKSAVDALKGIPIYTVIHNAGAYSIPRRNLNTGLNNVFSINCAMPYYITKQLLPNLSGGRVIIVGSIAHNYSKSDRNDIDFKTRTKASLVYGNAKRYLMYAILRLSKECKDVKFAVTHPGITFTNITAHYPKLIFAIIKHPMKIIFMKPRLAALSIIEGLFNKTEPYSWIGPRVFNIWGKPSKKTLKTAGICEIERIYDACEEIYSKMC